MALNINGVEPTEIKFVKNGVTTDLTVLKYGDTAVWGKPFTLTCIKVDGISTIQPVITVNRVSSPNEQASTGELSSGDTVYYGDVLTIKALPQSLQDTYCVDPYTVNGVGYVSREVVTHTVGSNVIVRAGVQRYDKPKITCVVETTGIYSNNYTVTITNPNNTACNVSYDIYGSGQYLLKSDKEYIAAKGTITITGNYVWYKNGMRVEATLTNDYYGSKFGDVEVNNYESSTGETTTT